MGVYSPSSKRRLCRSRNLLEDNLVLIVVQTELDECVPILTVEIVIIHLFNDIFNSALKIVHQVSVPTPIVVKQRITHRSFVHKRTDNVWSERREIALSNIHPISRNIQAHPRMNVD